MEQRCWICVGLNKKQICFLDELSKNCKFSRGIKLRRTSILRALLTVAKKLDIDATGVRSERELKERITASFERYH